MDVSSFVDELLPALADTGLFDRVNLQTEGPVASGYAYVNDELFLRFYFNQVTGTTAFALIASRRRIWGIDFDNRRGWHEHPVDSPADHHPVAPLSVTQIIERLQEILSEST